MTKKKPADVEAIVRKVVADIIDELETAIPRLVAKYTEVRLAEHSLEHAASINALFENQQQLQEQIVELAELAGRTAKLVGEVVDEAFPTTTTTEGATDGQPASPSLRIVADAGTDD